MSGSVSSDSDARDWFLNVDKRPRWNRFFLLIFLNRFLCRRRRWHEIVTRRYAPVSFKLALDGCWRIASDLDRSVDMLIVGYETLRRSSTPYRRRLIKNLSQLDPWPLIPTEHWRSFNDGVYTLSDRVEFIISMQMSRWTLKSECCAIALYFHIYRPFGCWKTFTHLKSD